MSKRMGATMKPPHVQALGYALDGGRLRLGYRRILTVRRAVWNQMPLSFLLYL